jgi:DNA-binding HxlR family transcriptional regulator
MAVDETSIVDVLKVLADASRIRILATLAAHEASVEQLAETLSLRPPTISHHLSRLKALGLVSMRREGTTHMYRFEPERLRELNRTLEPERFAALAASSRAGADPFRAKVLRDFFVGETLKDIPANRAKRLVILEWLADHFEPGVRYPEGAVNEVIRRHHPDFATLRRELIINGLMDRYAGVYWRTEAAPAEPTETP